MDPWFPDELLEMTQLDNVDRTQPAVHFRAQLVAMMAAKGAFGQLSS